MAATLAVLEADQHAQVASALSQGKTIAYNVQPCPGGGTVWPHITANGLPIAFLTPQQVALAKDALARGKTLGVSTHSASKRNQIDFS